MNKNKTTINQMNRQRVGLTQKYSFKDKKLKMGNYCRNFYSFKNFLKEVKSKSKKKELLMRH